MCVVGEVESVARGGLDGEEKAFDFTVLPVPFLTST